MLRSMCVLVVVTSLSLPVYAKGKWHTRFFFAVTSGKSFTTESAEAPSSLGGQDGWTCTANSIFLWERVPGLGGFFKSALITCTHQPRGIESEIKASCQIDREGLDTQFV